jgi:exonuclease III
MKAIAAFQWNVGMIALGSKSIQNIIRETNSKILLLQELNLNHFPPITGYTLYNNHKSHILISDKFEHVPHEISTNNEFICVTGVKLNLKGQNENITVISVYRKHISGVATMAKSKRFIDKWLNETLALLSDQNFVIGGDINCSHQSWNPLGAKVSDHLTPCGNIFRNHIDNHDFVDILNSRAFTHWVWQKNNNTKQRPSAIDITLGDNYGVFEYTDWRVGPQMGSDHGSITFNIKVKQNLKLTNRTEYINKRIVNQNEGELRCRTE